MKRIHLLLAAILVTSASFCATGARAVDDPLEFLHAMQKNGYSDIAVEYLKMIKDQPNAPKDVVDRWDLEMSQSLRAAAKTAYNEAEAKRFMDDAKKYLDKFIEADPKRPEAIQAGADWADISGQQALQLLRRSKDMTDKDQKAEALASVRKTLEEIRPRFVQAGESFQQTLAKIGAKDVRRRANMEGQLLETRLKIAMSDFYLALTYDDPKAPERLAGLEKAARTFDSIYQGNKGTIFGLQAHFMDGRARHEQGKLQDAKDIYEEVLANEEEGGSRGPRKKTGQEELFGEVQLHYLRCVAKESPKDYFNEALEWRKSRKATSERTDAYQGISFELAKNLLKASAQVADAAKGKYTTAAIGILREMGRVPSQYQQEAIKLRRELKGGDDADGGFEEFIVLGDDAAKNKKWTEAIEQYQKAVEVAPSAKIDKKRVDAVRNAIAGCHFNMARESFLKGDLKKTSEALNLILKDFGDTETAPIAAALEMNVAMNDYAGAADNPDQAVREAAEKRVSDIANSIIEKWPGKPEADAARLFLGRLKIIQQKIDEAAAIFKNMNPKSEHYATALYLTGYTYWRQYRIEKRAIEEKEEQNAAVTAEEKEKRDGCRKKALKIAQTAVELLKSGPAPSDGRMPRMLIDSQLLLAEITLEGGDAKEAAGHFQPLIDEVQKAEPKALDDNMLKIFNGGVQAYLQLNELDKAAKVSEVLLKLGPDAPNVNTSLSNFAKRIDAERKKADEAVENAKGATDIEAAKAKRDSYEKLLGDLLTNLSKRTKLSPGGIFWIARTMVAIKMTDEAEELGQKFLERMDNDAEFAPAGARAVPGVRAMLVSISRQKGKHAEALEQVDKLIEENPRALEPKMEKGQILQAFAEKDPSKYAKAVAHWERLRRGLERIRKKPREFYDVTYNEALCLYNWAKKDDDKNAAKENATSGRQLLKQLLLLDPKLNGPETVSRYRALVEKIDTQLGIEPEKKTGSK